jgi:hypothetical protein
MRRGIHELSDAEKRRVADELTMPVAPFGALVVAAVLFLASLLAVGGLVRAPASVGPNTHMAAR